MSNIIRGKFGNHFVDTLGINEYFKFKDGEEVNPKRFVVTPKDVYIVGKQDPNLRVGAGHGGREFIFWMVDGTVVNLFDIWHAKERTNESINCIKMENVYVPKEVAVAFSSVFWKYDVSENDIGMFNIPMCMKKPMLSNQGKLLSREEALNLCFEHYTYTDDEVIKFCYARLLDSVKKSQKPKVYFMDEARDHIDADLMLVRFLYKGVAQFEEYAPFILKSGWQHSMDPFQEILDELKSFYYDYVTSDKKSSFAQVLLNLRSKLLMSTNTNTMSLF